MTLSPTGVGTESRVQTCAVTGHPQSVGKGSRRADTGVGELRKKRLPTSGRWERGDNRQDRRHRWGNASGQEAGFSTQGLGTEHLLSVRPHAGVSASFWLAPHNHMKCTIF